VIGRVAGQPDRRAAVEITWESVNWRKNPHASLVLNDPAVCGLQVSLPPHAINTLRQKNRGMLFVLNCYTIAVDFDVSDIKTFRDISREIVVPEEDDRSMNDVSVTRQFAMRQDCRARSGGLDNVTGRRTIIHSFNQQIPLRD
jgi:hypothetical protein